MKRIVLFISVLFALFIVYYDLTTGTLPGTADQTAASPTQPPQEPSEPANKPQGQTTRDSIEVTIKPGDTLLSLIEQESGTAEQPMDTIIADFQSLNEGLKPEDMQIGHTYKIPVYH